MQRQTFHLYLLLLASSLLFSSTLLAQDAADQKRKDIIREYIPKMADEVVKKIAQKRKYGSYKVKAVRVSNTGYGEDEQEIFAAMDIDWEGSYSSKD
ncbi:MAG: hypothetical protein AAFP19_26070, partial [Bacteroidota bacterium]